MTATTAARTIYNPIARDRVTFLKTAAETGGETTFVEVELAPQGGNGLHYHTSYTERFTVISGELGIQLGTEQIRLHPGETALVEIGQLHRFFNSSDQTARFYTELRPGHAGFEQSLQIGYGLAADGKTNKQGIPTNPLALAVLVDMSDTRLPGVFTVLQPLFGLLARIARRNGTLERLQQRYCTQA